MSEYNDVLSIHDTAVRCKAERVPLSERTLRRLVADGELPAICSGVKKLLYWPNVEEFIKTGNNCPSPEREQSGNVRRISVR